ncbi:hypothetical protein C1645_855304 [Glomus cerebriforme]|uniref:Uncharacterized protein n=1 Tax=Glomus cerebriforme TaxID=658196 RepID=A0A397SLN7_9GLOM|nr:hypothetical protein C1645_855304 [Glomus cerebriforme]
MPFYVQKTFLESKRFQCLRYGTGATVIIIYLLYLAYLIIQITNDKPLVQLTYETLDKLSIPDIEICGVWSDVEISKCVFTWNNYTNTTFYNGCDALSHQFHPEKYCHTYNTSDAIYFYEFNPWKIDPKYGIDERIKTDYLADKRMVQEFKLQMNGFAGIQNTTTMITFKKVTLRTLLPRFSTIVGATTNYHSIPYLDLEVKNYPMHPTLDLTYTGHFSIAPGSFTHEVKSEKRSHTIFGSLGLAGGVFGMVSGIYTLLFGNPRKNPWGIMHRAEKLKIPKDADLQNFPFISAINPTKNGSTEQRVEQLENRILELESILKDYVFNPSALERLVEKSLRTRWTKNNRFSNPKRKKVTRV